MAGKGGVVIAGELVAAALHPHGLPRRARPGIRDLATASAGQVRQELDRSLDRLARQALHAPDPVRRRLVERAERIEALSARWTPGRCRDRLARVVRALPEPDRLYAGLAAPNLIVNTGENFLVDAWQNLVELEVMKYHGVGTGAVAAAEGDTALGAESTTILNPDSTRATGSLTEGASTNIFRTVGTVVFDGSGAITEWGLFNQAATGGGVLWSRIVFAAINVADQDSIQFTYDVTVE